MNLHYHPNFSIGSVDLISKMLERDVDKRIDIHQVLAHPWLHSS
jgi:serine/threonine protein kinase